MWVCADKFPRVRSCRPRCVIDLPFLCVAAVSMRWHLGRETMSLFRGYRFCRSQSEKVHTVALPSALGADSRNSGRRELQSGSDGIDPRSQVHQCCRLALRVLSAMCRYNVSASRRMRLRQCRHLACSVALPDHGRLLAVTSCDVTVARELHGVDILMGTHA
jgi:hypothetical protein